MTILDIEYVETLGHALRIFSAHQELQLPEGIQPTCFGKLFDLMF